MNPFEWFSVLTESKVKPEDLSDYNSFMINRVASMNKGTILYADEVNKQTVSENMACDWYLTMLPKGKINYRYIKSRQADEDIELVQTVYKVNRYEASQYLDLLSREDIEKLKQCLFTGGLEESKKSKTKK